MKSIQSNIKKAKKYLDKNHCVAIPTETVYGLAGNAYSGLSVKKIFKLKKRPMNNPLIVHYSNIDKLKNDCVISNNFIKLYNEFSPGPLVAVKALAPFQFAPIVIPIAASSSSACINANLFLSVPISTLSCSLYLL